MPRNLILIIRLEQQINQAKIDRGGELQKMKQTYECIIQELQQRLGQDSSLLEPGPLEDQVKKSIRQFVASNEGLDTDKLAKLCIQVIDNEVMEVKARENVL